MSESMRSVFEARWLLRREQLDIEKQLKENHLRHGHREEWHQQGLLFCPDDKAEKMTCKYERKLASLQSHKLHLQRRLEETMRRFEENDGLLHRLENEMKLLGNSGHAPKELKQELQCHRLQLQVMDLQQHVDHVQYLINLQDQENKHTHKLVHTLLPACRRQHLELKAAGLTREEDESEHEVLEQLVRRERGVVWADQENANERSEAGESAGHTRLQPLLSFSHLVTHQNTPCSAEKHTRRVSQRLKLSQSPKVPSSGEEQAPETKPAPKMPIRRKLAISPAGTGSSEEITALSRCSPGLQEVLRHEGMVPLQYTPEIPGSTALLSVHPDSTFDVGGDEDTAAANATVILSPESSDLGMSQLRALRAHNISEVPKRLEIPSLLDLRKSKPSYMAMTSAAQGKRRLNWSGKEIGTDVIQGAAAPKRIKRDPSDPTKPLRVRRFGASSENEPSRRVVRSVSEGSLHLLGPRKSKPTLLGPTALFKKVTKRM